MQLCKYVFSLSQFWMLCCFLVCCFSPFLIAAIVAIVFLGNLGGWGVGTPPGINIKILALSSDADVQEEAKNMEKKNAKKNAEGKKECV
jgi:hypothetical protein